MNKKFKLGLLGLALAGVLGTQMASAAPMVLTDGDKIKLSYGPNAGGANGGGAFTVTGLGADTGGDTFLTFCLEFTEHITLSTSTSTTQYFVDVNTKAIGGGAGIASTYGGDVAGTSTPRSDPLSAATAWLYTQFRDVTNNPLGVYGLSQNNAASHNAMQLAIWKLENEIDSSFNVSYANTTAWNSYNSNTLAKRLVSEAVAATSNGWTGLGRVAVLNLYTGYSATTGLFTGASQSQLYLAPVPEPEIYAMMAAGLGLMGFVARRRKQAAV